jgi:hypothetical protein
MFRGRFGRRQQFGADFFTNKRASSNREKGYNTSCPLKNEKIRGIFVINNKELCSLLRSI